MRGELVLRFRHLSVLTIMCLLISGGPLWAFDATVAWSPVAEAAGYKIFVRQGEAYGDGVDVGAPAMDADGALRYRITGLPLGQLSHVAVASYGSGGESALSNEQSIIVNPTATPTQALPTPTATPAHEDPAATPTGTSDVGGLPTATASPGVTVVARCAELPATGCHAARRSTLSIKNRRLDRADSLKWKWANDARLDPDAAVGLALPASYALCLYDRYDQSDALLIEADIDGDCAAGACSATLARFTTAPDRNGSSRLALSARAGGSATISVQLQGSKLPLPAPYSPDRFFAQQDAVIVQLVRADGRCWEAGYLAPASASTAARFDDSLR